MKIKSGTNLSLLQRQQVRKATMNARLSMAKTKRIKTSNSSSKKKTTSGSLLSSLLQNKLNVSESSKNTTQVDKTVEEQKASYTEMKKMAAALQKYAKNFMEDGENGLFAKATPKEENSDVTLTEEEKKKEAEKVSAGKKKLTSELLDCVEDYNKMVSRMNKVNSSTMNMYLRQLKQYESANYQSLKEVGMSIEKDGTLTVNEDKLKNADVEELKKVFHEKGCFMERVSYKSKNIQSNAEYNLSNLGNVYTSSNYGKSGTTSSVGGSTYSAKS